MLIFQPARARPAAHALLLFFYCFAAVLFVPALGETEVNPRVLA